MTLSETHADRPFTLHGPPTLTRALISTRSFLVRNQMRLTTAEFETEIHEMKDENMQVTAIPLVATSNVPSLVEAYRELLPHDKQVLSSMFNTSHGHENCAPVNTTVASGYKRHRVDDYHAADFAPLVSLIHKGDLRNDVSLCYICTAHDLKPRFDPARAAALKLPKGPIRAQLVHGETVTLEDGRIIRPEDVCSPAEKGAVVLILDVPSQGHLNALLKEDRILAFHEHATEWSQRLHTVVHMVDRSVFGGAAYQDFIRRFPPQAKHIILSQGYNADVLQFHSAAFQQAKFALVDPSVYRLPYVDKTDAPLPRTSDTVIMGKPLMEIHIEPRPGKMVDPYDALPSLQAQLQEYATLLGKDMIPIRNASSPLSNERVHVAFTGTGSMLPSKYRNVSGIFAFWASSGLIMDCGEGTYGQFYRLFGGSEFNTVLKSIRCVFISHMHADHHLGTVKMMLKWHEVADPTARILLLAPRQMLEFLQSYSECQTFPVDRIDFIDAKDVLFDRNVNGYAEEMLKRYQRLLNIAALRTVRVDHCPNAYGLTFSASLASSEQAIVYSGDTRPTQRLVKAIKSLKSNIKERTKHQAHVCLIHEATFENDLKREAIERKHSTLEEARQVARDARVNELILTHFSQRYPKLSVAHKSTENSSPSMAKIDEVSAFDFMVIPVGRVSELQQHGPELVHICQSLRNDNEYEEEEK